MVPSTRRPRDDARVHEPIRRANLCTVPVHPPRIVLNTCGGYRSNPLTQTVEERQRLRGVSRGRASVGKFLGLTQRC
jgi:hypothetical protein